MRDAMRLTNTCRKSGEADSASFTKYAKESAASSKMFFKLLNHLLLLITKTEWMKSPLIAISYIEIAKESLHVIKVECDEGSPYSVLPNSP
jgi:hypothetical protein